ncbi:MAG: ral secretory system protein domain protein [Myxococcales bacterium]|nr:ral secretory system protein domain protein [Myxococcales bacterium]
MAYGSSGVPASRRVRGSWQNYGDELGDVKRIGDILVANGWVEPSILARALARQRETGLRLCSLLVVNGVLDADEASRALGEQHGVAAVLQKHIARRDESLVGLLPAALARACVALPIGRMGSGDVIVCVRDPSPALHTQLARAMDESILLAVAPAHQLEALVLEVYGPEDVNEFDVDLSTGPIASLDLDEMDAIDGAPSESMPDLGSLELVDLDASGVDKDASQSQSFQIHNQRPSSSTVDAPTHRTTPVALAPHATTTQRTTLPPVNVARTQTAPPGRAALGAGSFDGPSDLDDPVEITVPRTQTSPRAAPGRAALDAAGPTVPRTQTPMRPLDDAAGIAIARTQTPPRPGPGRSALEAAGPAISRTQTPSPALDAAAPTAVASTPPAAADSSWDLLDLAPSSRPEPGPARATPPSRAEQPVREQSAAAISLAAEDAPLELPTPSPAKRAWPTTSPKTTLGTALQPREPARVVTSSAPEAASAAAISLAADDAELELPTPSPARRAWPTSAPKTTLGTALTPREPAPPIAAPPPVAAEPPRATKSAWPTSAPTTTIGTALRPREPGSPTPPSGVPTSEPAAEPPRAAKPAWPTSAPKTTLGTALRPREPGAPTPPTGVPTTQSAPTTATAPTPSARESATPAPTPTPTPRAATPAPRPPTAGGAAPARPITPPIGIPSIVPPRAPGDPARTPPAARAALDRAAAAAAARPMPPPPRDPKLPIPAPPSRPTPPPLASSAPARPPAIAVGTQTQGAPMSDEPAAATGAKPAAAIAVGTQLSASKAVSSHLADAVAALAAARTEDLAFDAIMTFTATRWSSALLLGLDDAAATGRRGHGSQLSDDLAQWIVMSLHEPSLIQSAHTSKGVVTAVPRATGEVEGRLQRLLGMPSVATAIAIAVSDRPAFVIAVGDPHGDDTRTAASDLERVASALGAAVARLRGG